MVPKRRSGRGDVPILLAAGLKPHTTAALVCDYFQGWQVLANTRRVAGPTVVVQEFLQSPCGALFRS